MCPAAVFFSVLVEPRLDLGATTGLGGRAGDKDGASLTGAACFGVLGLGAGTGAD